MARAAATTPPFDPRVHAPLVRRALQSLGVPSEALDDAVQDVFVVLVRRAADFDRGRSLVNWLWGIARGVASTHRRTRSRRGRLHAALVEREAPAGVGPDEAWARARATELVTRFVDALDPGLREVFVRSELLGYSGPEIAAELGLNLNTAYARVRTVRQRFEAELVARESVVARMLRVFAPFWFVGSKSIATAAIGGALVVASVGLPRASTPAWTQTSTWTQASTPTTRTTTTTTSTFASARERRVVAKDEGMKTAMLTTVALTTVLAQASPAEARDRKPTAKRPAPAASDADADEAARVQGNGQVTEYIFDNDDVRGLVLKPEGMPVDARTRARFPSLLQIRGHFLPELITMAKDV